MSFWIIALFATMHEMPSRTCVTPSTVMVNFETVGLRLVTAAAK